MSGEPAITVGKYGGQFSVTRQPRRFARLRAFFRRQRELCRVYWGSHGCDRPRGHSGPHVCGCAPRAAAKRGYLTPEEQADGEVGAPPYYGPRTRFYGEDA